MKVYLVQPEFFEAAGIACGFLRAKIGIGILKAFYIKRPLRRYAHVKT
jgi:hypothetical protein